MSAADEPAFFDPFPLLDADSPFVDVPRLLGALRRRWRVWALTSVIGLLAGMLFSVVVPPPASATTSLILAHARSANASHDMENDVQLASSTTVARRAMARLGLRGSPADFAAGYTPKSVSDSILQITVTGRTAKDAVGRAQAIAVAFLEFHRAQIIQEARGVLSTLQDRGAQLQEQLGGVEADPGTFSVGSSDSGDVAGVLDRQRSLATQVEDVRRQMEDTVDETRTLVENSTVVDPPVAVAASRIKVLTRILAAALILGAAAGGGLVILQETISNRVRRRQDVVTALRAPVLVSTGPVGRSPRGDRGRLRVLLLGTAGEGASIARVAHHLRATLADEHVVPQTLLVVSVESDSQTARAVAVAAKELAAEGRTVLLSDFTRRSSLARLLGLSLIGTSTVPVATGAIRVTCAPDELEAPNGAVAAARARRDPNDVVLTIASLDPAQGAVHLTAWATTAVAVVTAGRSSVGVLRSTGQLLRAAGIVLTSVALIGADPRDDTVGLPDQPPDPPPVDAPPVRWANP